MDGDLLFAQFVPVFHVSIIHICAYCSEPPRGYGDARLILAHGGDKFLSIHMGSR